MDEHARDLDFVPDMAPTEVVSPIEAARERTAGFVRNICHAPLLAIQQRMDELANMAERIKKSEAALSHYIGEFAQRCAEAESLANDIKPIIETAVSPFRADPPATITQLKNGDGR